METDLRTILKCLSLQMVVAGVYLNFSFCASSNAALRDLSSWSASSSLIFSTASWPSLAERASVRSSTCDRSSLNILSVWYCSEFHLSARKRVWFNSEGDKPHLFLETEKRQAEMHGYRCLKFYHPASPLLFGWLKPSPHWERQLHCAAADFPDADWTRSDSVAPLKRQEEEERAPVWCCPEGQPGQNLNSRVCLW